MWLELLFFVLTTSYTFRSTKAFESFLTFRSEHHYECLVFHLSPSVLTINCYNVSSWDTFIDYLKKSFPEHIISSLSLNDFNISKTTEKDFQGLTLLTFSLKNGSIGIVTEEVFSSIPTLTLLSWTNVRKINSIPESLAVTNLQALVLRKVGLTNLGSQLQNMTRLHALDLSDNKISFVHPNAFLNCFNLFAISFANNIIEHLDRTIFANVNKLETLNLGFNRISTLDGVMAPAGEWIDVLALPGNMITDLNDAVTVPLPRLKFLDLNGNPLQVLHSDSFKHNFPNLWFLALSNTSLHTIEEGSFDSLTKLKAVSFNDNNLAELPDDLFALDSLRTIILKNNMLRNVSRLFGNVSQLLHLDLRWNKIESIEGAFTYFPELLNLSLSGNMIKEIPDGAFAGMPKLQRLCIGNNRIENLNRGSFHGLEKNLKLLNLKGNILKKLGGALNTSEGFHGLVRLILRNNRLTSLADTDFNIDRLLTLIASNNQISILDKAFVNLRNLRILDLRFNKLTTFSRDNFHFTEPLIRKIRLEGNMLSCDDRLWWLISIVNNTRPSNLAKLTCHSPKSVAYKRFRDLSQEEVVYWKENCPKQCESCKSDHSEKNLTIHVFCSGRNISVFPEILPEWTSFVNLSGNLLRTLPTNLEQRASKLQRLDVRGNLLVSLHSVQMPPDLRLLYVARNNLVSLDKVQLPPGLKLLDLSYNRIQRFPTDILSKLNLTNIKLSHNALICDCLTDQFRTWINSINKSVHDINEVICSIVNTNQELLGKRISDLSYVDLCPTPISLYIIVTICVLGLLFGGSAGALGYIRYQMPIKVWLYTKGLCLRWIKDEDLDEDKDYDAFIAFSSDEQDCVDTILKKLEEEEPHYKLFVHYRNFIGGELIVDNIARAVSSSKKTIVLLSRSFLESEWTMQEFREAHRQTMEQKNERIILVLMEDLHPNQEINADVQAYMQTATYLKWKEKYFWEKLYYAMPSKPVRRDTISPSRITVLDSAL